MNLDPELLRVIRLTLIGALAILLTGAIVYPWGSK